MLKGQSCLSILQTISDGILIVDNKKHVHFVNNHMTEIFANSGAFTNQPTQQLPLELISEELQSPQDFLFWVEEAFETRSDVITDILFKDGRVYECKSCLLPIDEENEGRLWNFRNITHPRQTEKAIRAIIKGTSLAIGLDFFRALVKQLAEILGYRYALVGELVNGNKIRTLAVWAGDTIVDNMTYDLPGTPCANVSSQGMCLYRSDIQTMFPDDHLLVEMDAQSYFGIPLKDKSNRSLGILVLLDDKPMVNIPFARDLLQVFASRAANELSRMKAEHDLHHREAFEMLLSTVSTQFMELPPEQTDEGIMFTLKTLGEFAELDRVYLFEFVDQMTHINNTHEWCATGISCEIDWLQKIPCSDLPWAIAPILRNETLYVPSVADIPDAGKLEREHWKEQEIQSLVCVPVLTAGKLHGFLGFDSVKKVRLWNESDLKLLKTFAEVIGNALEHQKRAAILYDTFREAQADRNNITAILNSVADALIVTDTDKQVLLMNQAAERLLDDTLPKTCKSDFSVSSVLTKLKDALSDELPRKPFDIEIPTGDTNRPLTLQARVAETQDATATCTGHVVSLRDVTREREIDRMKSEFISTAAHELNTPLSAIMGYTEMLLDEEEYGGFTEEKKLDFLAEIYRRSEALSFIIDDLLDITRIESGRPISLDLKECNAEELLTKVVDYYRTHDTKHVYQLQLPKEQNGSTITIDYQRINQVLENLLSNASKYSPEGKQITVCGTVSADEWEVMVKDQGIGMNKDQVERVFDKFFRADTSDTSVGGLGLGMSIALQIIKAHGGKIDIFSEEKKGTTVTLKIPKNPTTQSSNDNTHTHSHSEPHLSLHH